MFASFEFLGSFVGSVLAAIFSRALVSVDVFPWSFALGAPLSGLAIMSSVVSLGEARRNGFLRPKRPAINAPSADSGAAGTLSRFQRSAAWYARNTEWAARAGEFVPAEVIAVNKMNRLAVVAEAVYSFIMNAWFLEHAKDIAPNQMAVSFHTAVQNGNLAVMGRMVGSCCGLVALRPARQWLGGTRNVLVAAMLTNGLLMQASAVLFGRWQWAPYVLVFLTGPALAVLRTEPYNMAQSMIQQLEDKVDDSGPGVNNGAVTIGALDLHCFAGSAAATMVSGLLVSAFGNEANVAMGVAAVLSLGSSGVGWKEVPERIEHLDAVADEETFAVM